MDQPITGMMVYYYIVCKRKLWYFCHQINMEQNNDDVQIGKTIDEGSYARSDKHININDVINIDFIQKGRLLHEVKKSKKIEEASIWQVKYYLYYLKNHDLEDIKAKIDYPLLKQTIDVILEADDENKLEVMLKNIQQIMMGAIPPMEKQKKICPKCAYFDLCVI